MDNRYKFTRHCWTCKKICPETNGTTNKRTKMWSCMECSEAKKWNRGNPPSLGWWPTKDTTKFFESVAYRWWNGSTWSFPAFEYETAVKAKHWASKKETTANEFITWAGRPASWPERSRT